MCDIFEPRQLDTYFYIIRRTNRRTVLSDISIYHLIWLPWTLHNSEGLTLCESAALQVKHVCLSAFRENFSKKIIPQFAEKMSVKLAYWMPTRHQSDYTRGNDFYIVCGNNYLPLLKLAMCQVSLKINIILCTHCFIYQ